MSRVEQPRAYISTANRFSSSLWPLSSSRSSFNSVTSSRRVWGTEAIWGILFRHSLFFLLKGFSTKRQGCRVRPARQRCGNRGLGAGICGRLGDGEVHPRSPSLHQWRPVHYRRPAAPSSRQQRLVLFPGHQPLLTHPEAQPATYRNIVSLPGAEYEVAPAHPTDDLLRLVQAVAAKGFVEVVCS